MMCTVIYALHTPSTDTRSTHTLRRRQNVIRVTNREMFGRSLTSSTCNIKHDKDKVKYSRIISATRNYWSYKWNINILSMTSTNERLTKNMICIVLEIPLQDSIKQSVGVSASKGTTYKKIILSVLLK